MKPFYCLLVQGGNLDDGVRDALYMAAASMLRAEKRRIKFTDEMAQGIVTTEGKRGVLSSAISGIKFSATIDCVNGSSIKCSFLMDDRNLIPEEDFFEDKIRWRDLRPIIFYDDEGEGWKKADD